MIACYLFLIVLLSKRVFGRDSLCKFEIQDGQYIDLRKVPTMDIDLSECGEPHHLLKINLCKNLGPLECESKVTDGPGNACDFFDSGDDDNVYWVGGVTQYSKSQYNLKKSRITMTYEGQIQTKTHPFWTRNVRISVRCDKKGRKKPRTSCYRIENDYTTATTTYVVKVTTTEACPIAEPRRILGIVIVVFVFGFTGFVLIGYVCLSVGAGLTLLTITCAMVAGSSFFLEFGKTYLEKLEKKRMKKTGVTIDGQESSGEDLDLDIAPLLEDDVKKDEDD